MRKTPIPLSELAARMLTAQEEILKIALQTQKQTNKKHISDSSQLDNITVLIRVRYLKLITYLKQRHQFYSS
jgi:hypothetical protein